MSPPIFRGSTILVSSQRKSVVHCGNEAERSGRRLQKEIPAVSLRSCSFSVQKWEKPWRINAMQAAHGHSLRFPCFISLPICRSPVFMRVSRATNCSTEIIRCCFPSSRDPPHRSRRIILQFGSDCIMDGVMDPRLSCAGSMASPSRPITAGRRNTDLCVRVNTFRGWSDHPCRYPRG